ncbi:MAG: aspartate carbamoyltransferase [Candidatus Velthaea sp.]
MNRTVIVAGLAAAVAAPVAALAQISASRKAEVERKSERVMPFDMNATMHAFDPKPDGGVQTVMVHTGDRKQIALVRGHLRKEAAAFARGNFSDPVAIHDPTMPGLAELRRDARKLTVRYADTPSGGSITYASRDPKVVAAVHAWFKAQTSDHGEHATMKM